VWDWLADFTAKTEPIWLNIFTLILPAKGRPMKGNKPFTADPDFDLVMYEAFVWGKKLFEIYWWIWDIINTLTVPQDWSECIRAARCLAKEGEASTRKEGEDRFDELQLAGSSILLNDAIPMLREWKADMVFNLGGEGPNLFFPFF
jgi:hypothetical protein